MIPKVFLSMIDSYKKDSYKKHGGCKHLNKKLTRCFITIFVRNLFCEVHCM